MISIGKTSLTVEQVFTDCISTVDDLQLKRDLTACLSVLKLAEKDFNDKFEITKIFEIAQNPVVFGRIDKKQMKIVYDYRMVRTGMAGRVYYDEILDSAPFGKCPLCSVRTADTIDHYLPKMKYPIFAVTPITLVPACTLCNKGKKTSFPKSSNDQTLHPYYDKVDDVSWLKGEIIQSNPVTFNFFVEPAPKWSTNLFERVKSHFTAYQLNELFALHANEEFRGAQKQLTNLFNLDPREMRNHLFESFQSRLDLGLNSWQSVMYKTLYNDKWFCAGGFLL